MINTEPKAFRELVLQQLWATDRVTAPNPDPIEPQPT